MATGWKIPCKCGQEKSREMVTKQYQKSRKKIIVVWTTKVVIEKTGDCRKYREKFKDFRFSR